MAIEEGELSLGREEKFLAMMDLAARDLPFGHYSVPDKGTRSGLRV